MDPSHLTQKSQEALHDAQTKALRYGHTEVDGEHLLLALLDQPEGIVPRLLAQAAADPDRLRKNLEAELERRPRVSGPGVAPGQINISQRLSRALVNAQQEADRLKDEYVSVEHLVMALLEEGQDAAAGRLLRQEGLTKDGFLQALVAAFAAGVFALVTSDIWRLAEYLGPLRLTIIALGSVGVTSVTIVIATGLWERSPHPAAREQVVLFNIVTAATVGIGVAVLYAALFVAMLAAALLLVPADLLSIALRSTAGVADQVRLAWLATSIATLGGALGAALESHDSVREAAYSYQPDTQFSVIAEPPAHRRDHP